MPPHSQGRRTYVAADTREPADVRLALSANLDDPVEFYALPEADFLLVDPDGCMLGIERKTVSDFLASLGDGRLVSQLTRMRGSYPHQGLILEGSYTLDGEGFISTSIGTRWTHAALQMTLFSLQQNFPALVIFPTIHLGATVDVIRALASRGKVKGCFFKTTLFAGLVEAQEGSGDYKPVRRTGSTRQSTGRRRSPAYRGR